MGLVDASSTTNFSDSRQAAGDASNLLRGNSKVNQGSTDYTRAKINVTGTDLSKTRVSGKNNSITVGANPEDLTALAQRAIDSLGAAASSHGGPPAPSPASPADLSSFLHNALAAAGIGGQPPSSSASSGDDNSGAATSSSGGLAGWWNGLSKTVKWSIAVGGVLLIGALIFFGRKT